MKSFAVKQGDCRDHDNREQQSDCEGNPLENPLPLSPLSWHTAPPRVRDLQRKVANRYSKCLAQRDKELRLFDSWRRIEVVADIDTYRTNGSLIPESCAERVRVVRSETAEADVIEDIPSVVK